MQLTDYQLVGDVGVLVRLMRTRDPSRGAFTKTKRLHSSAFFAQNRL